MQNYGRRKCLICGSKLIKKGFDKAKNQIWYCKQCKKYHIFKRKDIQNKLWLYRYFDFLLNKKSIKDLNISKSIFYRKISKFRNTNIFLPIDTCECQQLFIDALWIKKKYCYLIARNEKFVIGFGKYDSECYETWLDFLNKFKQPKYVICDGQNGMIKAIRKVWPKT